VGHAAPQSQREGNRSEQGHDIAGYLFWSDPAHEWHHHCGYGEADRNREVGIGESLDLRFPIGRRPHHRIAPGLDVMAGHPVQPADELRIREIQISAMRKKCRLVLSLTRVADTAMPMAPPRLRMSAWRPH